MTEGSVRVACLGAGYFSRFHYDAWRRIEDAELVGSADKYPERSAASGAPIYADIEGLLSGSNPDILDIITPPHSHLQAISAALNAGVKVIICQKPFCISLDEAKQAVELADEAGVPLIVHENFRFQPWYRTIADAISAGELGDIHQMTFRLRTGDGQGPDAYLDRQPYFQTMKRLLVHETAVHWIDTFRYLLGEVTAVYADTRRMNPVIAGEDAAYIVFDFQGDVRAVFDGNRHLDHASKNCRLTFGEALVEGTAGTLTLSGDGTVELRRFGETEMEVLLSSRDWRGFAGDCVFALQKHVVDGFLGKMEFENTAGQYLRVMEIEEAVYRSAQERRKLEV